ncbi:MAG: type II secretion system protein GspG [Acidobacteriaceae bacterium]|nr:type II secretion system protein GspG [Acidobacteriaceae bacterium]
MFPQVKTPPAYARLVPAEAQADADDLQTMLRDFRTVLGENPVGTNAEIMRALMGSNPKQLNVGAAASEHLNEKGELVDRWGTPYFFHQLAKDQMEVRSAGPDRVMWTEDDVVAK